MRVGRNRAHSTLVDRSVSSSVPRVMRRETISQISSSIHDSTRLSCRHSTNITTGIQAACVYNKVGDPIFLESSSTNLIPRYTVELLNNGGNSTCHTTAPFYFPRTGFPTIGSAITSATAHRFPSTSKHAPSLEGATRSRGGFRLPCRLTVSLWTV